MNSPSEELQTAATHHRRRRRQYASCGEGKLCRVGAQIWTALSELQFAVLAADCDCLTWAADKTHAVNERALFARGRGAAMHTCHKCASWALELFGTAAVLLTAK